MSEFKLEVGKPYRTRDGKKVNIVETISSIIRYEAGYRFLAVNEYGDCFAYTEDGFYHGDKTSHRLDIVAEWEEETLPNPSKDCINPDESILREAERIISGDRMEAYGDVKESFESIAKGWSVIFDKEVTGSQVGLAMAWLKICRENNNHKRDNLVDIAGYAALIEKL